MMFFQTFFVFAALGSCIGVFPSDLPEPTDFGITPESIDSLMGMISLGDDPTMWPVLSSMAPGVNRMLDAFTEEHEKQLVDYINQLPADQKEMSKKQFNEFMESAEAVIARLPRSDVKDVLTKLVTRLKSFYKKAFPAPPASPAIYTLWWFWTIIAAVLIAVSLGIFFFVRARSSKAASGVVYV